MNIRTKIIGGYVLFVALILSFLGLNYLLQHSVMNRAAMIYDRSEDIRMQLEAENAFWRQVIASTDYFLEGTEDHEIEFHDGEKVFQNRMEAIAATASSEEERAALREINSRYAAFVAQFERAAAVYKSGRTDAARTMEEEEVNAAEQQTEQALDRLLAAKRAESDVAMAKVRSYKKFASIFPSLSGAINDIEVIYSENHVLQHAAESESDFLLQAITITDLFLSDKPENIEKFRQYGELFQKELAYQKQSSQKNDERVALDAIDDQHRTFTEAFERTAKKYQTGDKADAWRLKERNIDPVEIQVGQAITQFYPFKQQSMKRSLDNVTVSDATAVSITGRLGGYVFLMLVLGLGLGIVSAIRVTGPLSQLAEATRTFATGDFSRRVKVRRRDEVGRLAASFNEMAETLQQTTVSKDYVDGIIRSMGDSLVVASSDGKIVTVNQATCQMLGFAECELIGQPLGMIFDDDLEVSKEELSRLNRKEGTYRGKDGHSIPVAFSCTPMHLDSDQAPGLVCVAKDITELRKAADAVRQSEHKLSLHIQQTPLAVIEWNLDAEIVEWNPAAEAIFGYRKDEVLGRQIVGLLVPESSRERAELEWNDLLSEKVGRHTTYKNLTKDGRTIICEWYNTPLDSEGRVIGVASMIQDFTQRTEMEEELKRMRDAALESARMKSEFLANMSHEIRTPMNGVIGMTGLLLDTELSDDQRNLAETIRTSGDSLLTIVNDILDFSKMEAGKLKFETLDFNLSNVVESTIELLAERAHAGKIELASLIHSDVFTARRGDPGRLRQVLTNLIGNALKFTEHGEVVVRVKNESSTDDHSTVRFEISDSGIGISDAAQKNLFDAFTQADGSTTRKYGGTGLGLAISKQLVEMMGGRIGVTSVEGKGSTFWFTARFEMQPADSVMVEEKLASLAGLRALIVDDNETNRKILSHQLSSWAMTYEQADSGRRALELARVANAQGQPYDLAILDLMMPEMDGFQLAREIKLDSAIAALPLVLLTSFGQRGDGTTAREAGIAAYLTKPVRQSQLFECLADVLGRTQSISMPPTVGTESDLVTKHTLTENKPMSNKLILIAEDNVVNQKVAVRQLQKLGYRADAVANGREALEALERISYDLVLMDCQMPEMDGYEATAELRWREGRNKHTPIVAMTAHALEGDRAKCIAAGMDDYISKPVRPEELGRVLERLFAGADEIIAGASLASPDSTPPVDIVRLHLAIGDDPGEVCEILNLYLTTMTKSLNDLNAAIDAGDCSAVELIGHNCAGTSANCGMTAVVDSLHTLETMGRKNQLAGADVLAKNTSHEFERVKAFLEENFQPAAV